jgi:hypothetical protein
MIERIGRRLRIPRRDNPGGPAGVESAAIPSHVSREVEFVAYGEDCVLSGHIRMNAERLSDMLNAHDEYLLTDVLLERLDNGQATAIQEVLVHRHELMLIHATGPRGSAGRRRRTRAHPVALGLGVYTIRGDLHGLPGADAIEGIRRRETMVPLTDAWIDYQSGSVPHRRRVGGVVVNRERIDWIIPADGEEIGMRDLPFMADEAPHLQDLTGASFDHS